MTAEAMSTTPQRIQRRPVTEMRPAPATEVRTAPVAKVAPPVRQVATVAQVRQPVAARTNPEKAWWFVIPNVAMACAKVVLFPLTVITKVAELAMAAVVLGIGAVGFMWWTGRITDLQIIEILRPLGDRILAMVQSSGAL